MYGILALAALAGGGQSVEPDLRLGLHMEQATYEAEGPVDVRMTLENVSALEIVVNRRLLVNLAIGPHEIFFVITDPDGERLPFQAHIRDSFESREFMLLYPREYFGRTYNLARSHFFEKNGEYTAVAYYENAQDTPEETGLAAAWKGRLKSNTVKFTIRGAGASSR